MALGRERLGKAPMRVTVLTLCLVLTCLFVLGTPASHAASLTVGTWTGGFETDLIQAIIDDFMLENPHVDVEIVLAHGGPWGRDKYMTMFAGGAAPDIILLNSGNFELFARQGFLYAIDDMIAKDPDFDIDAFFPPSIEGSSLQGVVYALPYDISNHVPFYNVDMFNEMGVPAPQDDWTWDDMIDKARKLTFDRDGDGEIDTYGLGIAADEWHWNTYLAQSGVELFSEDGTALYADSPEFVEFVEWYFGLMWERGVAPHDPGGLWRFPTEGIAMSVYGPWHRANLAVEAHFQYDMAPIPRGERLATIYYVDQFAITSDTAYPDEAWQLLKFLTGSQAWDAKFSMGEGGGRSLPPLREYALTPDFLEYDGLSNYIFLDALAVSERSIASNPSGLGRDFHDIWWPTMWTAWEQQQPIRPLLEDVQRQAVEKLGFTGGSF